MELWIRSQIGYTLIKCIMLELDNDKTGIFAYNGDNQMVLAGKYKTQERALEVLDEIQKYLKTPKVMVSEYGSVDYLNVDAKVYEMPQE